MKSKLLGIILTIAVIGIFAACDDDDPQPTCVCATPHYLTCADYNCTVSHSHSQKEFTTLGGINVYVTVGVTADDALKTKVEGAWSFANTTKIEGNVNRINIVNTGAAASISGTTLTINGSSLPADIVSTLDTINTNIMP